MALIPFPGPPRPSGADDDPEDDLQEEPPAEKMSFLEHLDELRRRLVVSVVSVPHRLPDRVRLHQPDLRVHHGSPRQDPAAGGKLIYTEPTRGLHAADEGRGARPGWCSRRRSSCGSSGSSSRRGCAKEKRFAVPFVLFSTISFVLGVAFAHYVVFPAAWAFFASYERLHDFHAEDFRRLRPVSYMLLAFGVIFQMPVLVLALARDGTRHGQLPLAAHEIRHPDHLHPAAVITPSSDVVNQSIMAGPMIVLYMLSIVIAWVFGKKKRATDE